jgi:hypothetical protein
VQQALRVLLGQQVLLVPQALRELQELLVQLVPRDCLAWMAQQEQLALLELMVPQEPQVPQDRKVFRAFLGCQALMVLQDLKVFLGCLALMAQLEQQALRVL